MHVCFRRSPFSKVAIAELVGWQVISAISGGVTDLSFHAVGYAWQILNCFCTSAYSVSLHSSSFLLFVISLIKILFTNEGYIVIWFQDPIILSVVSLELLVTRLDLLSSEMLHFLLTHSESLHIDMIGFTTVRLYPDLK
jgi:hypothetical protein